MKTGTANTFTESLSVEQQPQERGGNGGGKWKYMRDDLETLRKQQEGGIR